MATETIVTLTDSLDPRVSTGVETVTFYHPAFGTKLEIELSEQNRKHFGNLLDKMQKYIDAAEVVEEPTPASKPKAAKNNDTAKIREWARANGFTVGDRGRISEEIMTAYSAAHEVVSTESKPAQISEAEASVSLDGETQVVEEPSESDLDEQVDNTDDDSDILAMLAEIDAETGGNFTAEDVAAKLDQSNDNE